MYSYDEATCPFSSEIHIFLWLKVLKRCFCSAVVAHLWGLMQHSFLCSMNYWVTENVAACLVQQDNQTSSDCAKIPPKALPTLTVQHVRANPGRSDGQLAAPVSWALCCRTGNWRHLQSVRKPGRDSEAALPRGPRWAWRRNPNNISVNKNESEAETAREGETK